ncbi:hypothetical protein [Thermogymnomonas acidicola]|uniref:hypothetical protein n=1 Tax=Thermogymnomonas acidicola TaxID=399579 RepID=UPI0009465C6D|nr:hypothetical protein [Thermogymnomonas acidicola]
MILVYDGSKLKGSAERDAHMEVVESIVDAWVTMVHDANHGCYSSMMAGADTMEERVKRNMLLMVSDTVESYLRSYWKDLRSLNSEVTDSMYRAKHRLFSSVVWDLERSCWEHVNEVALDRVRSFGYTERTLMVVDPELSYWFQDHMPEVRRAELQSL